MDESIHGIWAAQKHRVRRLSDSDLDFDFIPCGFCRFDVSSLQKKLLVR